jgi:hypothetical protein
LADPPTDAEITLIRAWNSNQGRELLEKNEQKIKKEQVILIWTNAVNQLPLPFSHGYFISLECEKKDKFNCVPTTLVGKIDINS